MIAPVSVCWLKVRVNDWYEKDTLSIGSSLEPDVWIDVTRALFSRTS